MAIWAVPSTACTSHKRECHATMSLPWSLLTTRASRASFFVPNAIRNGGTKLLGHVFRFKDPLVHHDLHRVESSLTCEGRAAFRRILLAPRQVVLDKALAPADLQSNRGKVRLRGV